MTKDTEEFSQFTESVACREYTLPRDENLSEPKGWIRGNTKIFTALQVTTSNVQGKYGVEIIKESINKDHSHSWVRISHGFNKLVTNLHDNEQDYNKHETSEMQFEDYALKSNVLGFASRSKAKAKPQRRISASSSTKTVPIGERTWTDIEPQDYSPIDCSVSEETDQSSTSWSSTARRRWSDWILENKRLSSEQFCAFSTLVWWKVEEHNGKRRRKQENISILYRFFRSDSLPPSSSRSLRTQSHWSFITVQCINSGRFLRVHLSRRVCNQVTFHHQFRIDTRRTELEQNVLSACGSYEQRTQRSWDSRSESTASCTIHADSVIRNIKTRCIGSTSDMLQRKDWSSIRRDRTHHPLQYTPSRLYSEAY